jgi:dinuclear metal center YbgI/SA1388 family protein
VLERNLLTQYLNELLRPSEFNDYGPNGLQVEGREQLSHIAFAVSATKESCEKAREIGANALIVHHGLFWHFHGVRTLTGPFAKRVYPLIDGKINLYGFHLPLDAHPEVGNATGIARRLGLRELAPFGDHKGSPTGIHGQFTKARNVLELKKELEILLGHNVLIASPNQSAEIKSLGIITGGANSGWKDAAKLGLDAYLTGEMSEHDWHESQEAGVHMFAGGHHATERFGIQDLMARIKSDFPTLTYTFIPSSNPA